MARRALGAALALVAAAAQSSCDAHYSCGGCAAATGCAWCDFERVSVCIESRQIPLCPAVYNSSGACPALPSVNGFAWAQATSSSVIPGAIASLCAAAWLVLAMAVLTPCERRWCGLVTPAEASPIAQGPSLMAARAALASACLMWTGLALSTMAPFVPWLGYYPVSDTRTTAVGVFPILVDAFFYYNCAASVATQTFCTKTPFFDFIVSNFLKVDPRVETYAKLAQTLGALNGVFAMALVLPSTIMISVATHRIHLARAGIQSYVAGCSPGSLRTAQGLGLVGVAGLVSVLLAAVVACALVAARYAGLLFGDGATVAFAALPGVVVASAGASALLVGLAFARAAAAGARSVAGVGSAAGSVSCLVSARKSGAPSQHVAVELWPIATTRSTPAAIAKQ